MCVFQQITNQNIQSSSLLCHFDKAWCLASFFADKLVFVQCEVLQCGDFQAGLQVLINETTPMCWFLNLYHWKEFLTKICATKHAHGLSHLQEELRHFFRNAVNELCSVVLCLLVFHYTAAQSAPFESGQVQFSRWWQMGCEATKNSFFCTSKSPKCLANSSHSALSWSVKCAFGNTVALTLFKITWQGEKWGKLHLYICVYQLHLKCLYCDITCQWSYGRVPVAGGLKR